VNKSLTALGNHRASAICGREGPVTSDANNDWQMAQKIAVHSCTASHTECGLNHIIELCLSLHLLLCRASFSGAAADNFYR
jgi:hypothetical protein